MLVPVSVEVTLIVTVGVPVSVHVSVTVPVMVGVAVSVPVSVTVAVNVGVPVPVSVHVSVIVSVTVGVPVSVPVSVIVGVTVGVAVSVPVSVTVGVPVKVSVIVGVTVAVTVGVTVGVAESVEVSVIVSVMVGVGESVNVSVIVPVSVIVHVSLTVDVSVMVGVTVAVRVTVNVGEAVGVGGTYSYAPISNIDSCGLDTPSKSTGGAPVAVPRFLAFTDPAARCRSGGFDAQFTTSTAGVGFAWQLAQARPISASYEKSPIKELFTSVVLFRKSVFLTKAATPLVPFPCTPTPLPNSVQFSSDTRSGVPPPCALTAAVPQFMNMVFST